MRTERNETTPAPELVTMAKLVRFAITNACVLLMRGCVFLFFFLWWLDPDVLIFNLCACCCSCKLMHFWCAAVSFLVSVFENVIRQKRQLKIQFFSFAKTPSLWVFHALSIPHRIEMHAILLEFLSGARRPIRGIGRPIGR